LTNYSHLNLTFSRLGISPHYSTAVCPTPSICLVTCNLLISSHLVSSIRHRGRVYLTKFDLPVSNHRVGKHFVKHEVEVLRNISSKKLVMIGGVFAFGTLFLLASMLIAAVAVIPVLSPAAGAYMADLVRTTIGPRPVAALETLSFRAQDTINNLAASHNGGRLQINLNGDPSSPTTQTRNAHLAVSNTGSEVVTALSQVGWQAYGPLVNGKPVMAQTLVALDPQRPYAGIALVRIDLSKLQLHVMPGYQEPSHAANIVKAIPNIGEIPASDMNNLVAAFNGGFKAVNGNYGMMVNGITLLPPLPGIATIAVYKDGTVKMGAWGSDIVPSSDMVAFRQNCPLVLHNGTINSDVSVDNRATWGQTVGNQEITWRTGIGLSQDGRYLIYAVGNGTTVETIAKALLQAGAYNAMQLDINRPFAHFDTYQPAPTAMGHPTAVPLLAQMLGDTSIYLTPHTRDYFYLTTR
jgi:hypothetical protein